MKKHLFTKISSYSRRTYPQSFNVSWSVGENVEKIMGLIIWGVDYLLNQSFIGYVNSYSHDDKYS